jgi:ATP-dependent helicase HrpB
VVTRIGDIVLHQEQHIRVDDDEMQRALLDWLATVDGFSRLPFTTQSQTLKTRIAWARATYPDAELPDLSDEHLRSTLTEWLAPFLSERPTLQAISAELLDRALSSLVQWSHTRQLEELAPESLQLPSGRSRAIAYELAKPPTVAATIQELFGWRETPTLGPKRVPISLSILSPARRPMQITQDLASFWVHGYPIIRKELRGRYPKHRWPENAALGGAQPTPDKRSR